MVIIITQNTQKSVLQYDDHNQIHENENHVCIINEFDMWLLGCRLAVEKPGTAAIQVRYSA